MDDLEFMEHCEKMEDEFQERLDRIVEAAKEIVRGRIYVPMTMTKYDLLDILRDLDALKERESHE